MDPGGFLRGGGCAAAFAADLWIPRQRDKKAAVRLTCTTGGTDAFSRPSTLRRV